VGEGGPVPLRVLYARHTAAGPEVAGPCSRCVGQGLQLPGGVEGQRRAQTPRVGHVHAAGERGKRRNGGRRELSSLVARGSHLAEFGASHDIAEGGAPRRRRPGLEVLGGGVVAQRRHGPGRPLDGYKVVGAVVSKRGDLVGGDVDHPLESICREVDETGAAVERVDHCRWPAGPGNHAPAAARRVADVEQLPAGVVLEGDPVRLRLPVGAVLEQLQGVTRPVAGGRGVARASRRRGVEVDRAGLAFDAQTRHGLDAAAEGHVPTRRRDGPRHRIVIGEDRRGDEAAAGGRPCLHQQVAAEVVVGAATAHRAS